VPVFLDAGVEEAEDGVGREVGCRAGSPGIAIAGRVENGFGAYRARGSGLIDDDELGPEGCFKFTRGDARDLVGRTAGSPGNNDGDRF